MRMPFPDGPYITSTGQVVSRRRTGLRAWLDGAKNMPLNARAPNVARHRRARPAKRPTACAAPAVSGWVRGAGARERRRGWPSGSTSLLSLSWSPARGTFGHCDEARRPTPSAERPHIGHRTGPAALIVRRVEPSGAGTRTWAANSWTGARTRAGTGLRAPNSRARARTGAGAGTHTVTGPTTHTVVAWTRAIIAAGTAAARTRAAPVRTRAATAHG
jgi:hypothetical protein